MGVTYAQPTGVVTPKKQSSAFLGTTWFARTGVITTPADTMEAANATTRARTDFILDFWGGLITKEAEGCWRAI